MLKSLKLLKKYREIFLDVTIEEPEDFDEIGINFVNQFDEAIAELEALQQPKSCDGCKYGKYGADSRGIEVECTLIWHCARGNGFPDRYEPKDTK